MCCFSLGNAGLTSIFYKMGITKHSAVADVALVFLLALFFIFICLLVSILYHYRTRKPVSVNILMSNKISETKGNPQFHKKLSVGYYMFIFIVALLMPVLCLYLNNEVFRMTLGDFSGAWFYMLAIGNGMVMLVPRKNRWVTIAALFFKSMGVLYVFFLAVALLKYIPLAFMFFYMYLIPLLVLIPAVLIIAELFQIIDDFIFLRNHFKIRLITSVFICGMMLLCIGCVGNFYGHKANFDKALCYLNENEPEYPSVNISMLRTALAHVGQPLNSLGGEQELPLLSAVYRAIVLDKQQLTADSYNDLTKIFLPERAPRQLGQAQSSTMVTRAETGNVALYNVQTETTYDQVNGLYKTWIHLQMKNEANVGHQEFVVQFALPEGVFVCDYYLDMYRNIQYGTVSEMQSAAKTYKETVFQRLGSGIIYYVQGNTVELRVAHFAPFERRRTGFQVMYKQNDIIDIGGHRIALQGEELASPIIKNDTCFMPATCKASLEAIRRIPKYYFIADVSKALSYETNHVGLDKIQARITDYATQHNITDADVYVVAYNSNKTDIKHLRLTEGEGGFNMLLAMRTIYQDVKNYPGCYPVIMVSSSNIDKAVVADNHRFIDEYPESEFYYLINDDGSLTPVYFGNNTQYGQMDKPKSKELKYEGFYFANNESSEISYKNTRSYSEVSYGNNPYFNALLLNEKIRKATTKAQVIKTMKDGFSQRVLTGNNSFTVLQTKEQEEKLLNRNNDFLEG